MLIGIVWNYGVVVWRENRIGRLYKKFVPYRDITDIVWLWCFGHVAISLQAQNYFLPIFKISYKNVEDVANKATFANIPVREKGESATDKMTESNIGINT